MFDDYVYQTPPFFGYDSILTKKKMEETIELWQIENQDNILSSAKTRIVLMECPRWRLHKIIGDWAIYESTVIFPKKYIATMEPIGGDYIFLCTFDLSLLTYDTVANAESAIKTQEEN